VLLRQVLLKLLHHAACALLGDCCCLFCRFLRNFTEEFVTVVIEVPEAHHECDNRNETDDSSCTQSVPFIHATKMHEDFFELRVDGGSRSGGGSLGHRLSL